MTAIAIEDAPPRRTAAMTKAAIVIVVGVVATTLGQPDVLGRLPLTNLLKNSLHVSRADNAAFFFLSGLAWYFKPIAGIVTDAFPVMGSRRRSYLLASTLLAAIAWIVLIFTPHTYSSLLGMVIVINAFMVVMSTVIGGFMVEIAQATGGSGRLSSIREAAQLACAFVNGPVSGYLGAIAFGWTAAACGGVVFLLFPATLLWLQEQKRKVDSGQMLASFGHQLVNIGTAGTLWSAAGLTLLVYLAPGFTTALFYRQQDVLHMNTIDQGFLALYGGGFGVAGAITYLWLCRRRNLRFMLALGLAIGTAATFTYLNYGSLLQARMCASFNGFCGTFASTALMDLAVRATPAGSEGLGFSLMVSVRNITLFGSNWLGSMALDKFRLPFNDLVLANAATTAIAVPLVFLLPAIMVRRKDAEIYEEAPAQETALQD
jgi:predicted MFS family arabinose efflux permease